MSLLPLQFPSVLFEMAFTLAVIAGALLLVGVVGSLAVFAYRSTMGDGVEDPAAVVPDRIEDDEDALQEGDADDEWDYY
jgi:hypothetical protein